MTESIIATAEYDELLDSIKRTLAAGQLHAARAINNVLQSMIASRLHERSQPTLTTFDRAVPEADRTPSAGSSRTRTSSTSSPLTLCASATCPEP